MNKLSGWRMKTDRIALSFGLLLAAAAPSHAAKYKVKWLLGHPNLDYFEEAAAYFKTTVEKGSHGDIQVEIANGASLWEDSAQGVPGPEIAKAVASGEAQMGHSFTDVMGTMDHDLWAFDLPYAFRGYRHLEGVFEGPVGQDLLEGMRPHGLVGLAFTYSGGANGVATTDREVRGLEDFKGLKVGMLGDAVGRSWVTALGATPVAVRHREDGVFPLAEDGRVDSIFTTWRRFQRSNLDRRFKYFNMTGSSYLVSVTYVNAKFFDGLPAEYRKLLMDAARVTSRIERFKTIELNERAKREMTAKGVVAVNLTEANRLRFVEALKPVYARELQGLVGKDLIEKLRVVPDAPEHPTLTRLASR